MRTKWMQDSQQMKGTGGKARDSLQDRIVADVMLQGESHSGGRDLFNPIVRQPVQLG